MWNVGLIVKAVSSLIALGAVVIGTYFYYPQVQDKKQESQIQQSDIVQESENVKVDDEIAVSENSTGMEDVAMKEAKNDEVDKVVVTEEIKKDAVKDKEEKKESDKGKKSEKKDEKDDSSDKIEPIKQITSTDESKNNNIPLSARFTATGFRNTKIYTYTTQVFKGDTISFDASNSSGDIVSYEWDFGDGKKGTGKSVTNTYNTSSFSNFNVILTVTNKNGKRDHTGGYSIHYIGEPRLLISLDAKPEASANKYACGQMIKAEANTYSPYGEITDLDWELMRGAISLSRDSDKVLKTKTTDKDGTIDYVFDCGTVAEDAVLQERDGDAVYSFVVRKMIDSKGNKLVFDKNKGDGSMAIVVYVP